MCGSKKPATTTTSTAPPPEVMAAYQALLARATPLADTPYQQYTGARVAGFSGDQNAAFQTVRDAQGVAQPYIDQATGYATIGANPITGAQIANYQNPYQEQVIDATMADFNTQNARQLSDVRGNAALRGALGGNRVAVAEALAGEQQNRTQSPILANMRAQGWNSALGAAQADRGAAAQGAYTFGNLGNQALTTNLTGATAQYGMGAQQQALDQAGLNVPYQNFQEARAYPFQTTSWLSGITSGLGSQMGGTSTTSQPAPSPLNAIIGAAGTAAGGYLSTLSDDKAKDNIIPIGEMFDGTPLYRFNYKGSDETEIGVMASDVQQRDPGAVSRGPDGMRYVNYDRATAPAAMQGHYASGGGVGGSVRDIPGSGFMQMIPGSDSSNPLGGGFIGMMGDPGELRDNPFAWGLGGMAYKAIKGKAEGGPVMPYMGGFIPGMPITRGQGAPRGGAPAPASDNAAGNALQNLASMYRRRPGTTEDHGLGSWDAEVSPAVDGMYRGGGVVPRGYDDGGVVESDLPFQPSMGTLGSAMPMMRPPAGIPRSISGDDAMTGEGANASGAGGRFMDGPSSPWQNGQAVLPLQNAFGQSFTGSATDGTPVQMISTGQQRPTGVVPPAPIANGPIARPRTFAAPAMAPPDGVGGGDDGDPKSPTIANGGGSAAAPGGSTTDPNMRNVGLALMMAGLRTMASRSPWAGVAIGEGGQAGVQTYMHADQQGHQNRFSQQQIDLRARQLQEQARHNSAVESRENYTAISGAAGQPGIILNRNTGRYEIADREFGGRGTGGAGANPSRVREAEWMVQNGIAPDLATAHASLRESINSGTFSLRSIETIVNRLGMEEETGRRPRSSPAAREAEARRLLADRRRLNPGAYAPDPQPQPAAPPAPAQNPPAPAGGSTPAAPAGGPTPAPQGNQPGAVSGFLENLFQGGLARPPAPAASAGPVAPTVPPGVTNPQRAEWSPSRRQWRDVVTNRVFDENGRPVSGTGN